MNTTYRKNLKDAMTSCKNYTDETVKQAKEEIYWHIGEYSVTTSDDNTSASTKTVPSNATRCKIKRVYGNTQKLNPTTASDSTSAMIKTMPSTVYDFDVSKVEGNSEKSENLCPTATYNNIMNNTINRTLDLGNLPNGTYTISFNLTENNDNRTMIIYYVNNEVVDTENVINTGIYGTGSNKTFTFTLDGSVSYDDIRLGLNSGSNNYSITLNSLMLNKGSTALPYQPYFDGIHNFAWNGVKVEGANLINPSETKANTTFNSSNVESESTGMYSSGIIPVIPNTTYYVKGHFSVVIGFDVNISPLGSYIRNNSTANFSFTTPNDCYYVRLRNYYNNTPTYTTENIMSSIDIAYVSYVAPTTLPIDLSTILYNGNPLFEENALKGVGTAKDYITPYVAHKEIGSRAYQSGDEEDTSVLTDGTTTLYPLATPIEVSINWASTLRGITGYANGTITLLNTNNMDSANTITYNSIIKENCCAKMVQSRNGSVIKTINFPTQASDGYSAGSVANVRDFTTNKRIGNVSKENDLGSLDYTYESSYRTFKTTISDIISNPTSNILCTKYSVTSATTWDSIQDMEIGKLGTNSTTIMIKDTSLGTNSTTFKTAMANEPLYYELADASKTSTDITPLEENVIVVQAGDTLSFYDSEDNLVTIPTDLTYRIEVAN